MSRQGLHFICIECSRKGWFKHGVVGPRGWAHADCASARIAADDQDKAKRGDWAAKLGRKTRSEVLRWRRNAQSGP